MEMSFKSELTLSDTGFLFDHSSGLTYTLNPTGQFIFNKIKSGKKGTDILTSIKKEFDIDEDTARKDIDDFFRQLNELDLLN